MVADRYRINRKKGFLVLRHAINIDKTLRLRQRQIVPASNHVN